MAIIRNLVLYVALVIGLLVAASTVLTSIAPLLYLVVVGLLLYLPIYAVWQALKAFYRLVSGEDKVAGAPNGPGRVSEQASGFASVKPAAEIARQKLASAWRAVESELTSMSLKVQKRVSGRTGTLSRMFRDASLESGSDKLDFLARQLQDDELERLRCHYGEQSKKICGIEQELADIAASIAMHDEQSGGKYHRLQAARLAELEREKSQKADLVRRAAVYFDAYGVKLEPSQAEVLLSRVDAADVIQMTTVFSVISSMTRQFEKANVQSGENIEVAKKYYGMYIVLIELQMHIQHQYLSRLANNYIPGIELIMEEAKELRKDTVREIKASKEVKYRRVYEQNLRSQDLTIEVTHFYREVLQKDSAKVARANSLLKKHYGVAKNTLRTVQVSSDLSAVISKNEALYQEVMALQVPELVPFENLQVQAKFEAVTERLKTVQRG